MSQKDLQTFSNRSPSHSSIADEDRASDLWIRAATCLGFFSSCCQILRTPHPALLSSRATSRSRFLLRSSFCAQKERFDAGRVPCSGQQCQKHPSTKSASRSLLKTKSGLPNILLRRRHPRILDSLSTHISRSSVDAFS